MYLAMPARKMLELIPRQAVVTMLPPAEECAAPASRGRAAGEAAVGVGDCGALAAPRAQPAAVKLLPCPPACFWPSGRHTKRSPLPTITR